MSYIYISIYLYFCRRKVLIQKSYCFLFQIHSYRCVILTLLFHTSLTCFIPKTLKDLQHHFNNYSLCWLYSQIKNIFSLQKLMALRHISSPVGALFKKAIPKSFENIHKKIPLLKAIFWLKRLLTNTCEWIFSILLWSIIKQKYEWLADKVSMVFSPIPQDCIVATSVMIIIIIIIIIIIVVKKIIIILIKKIIVIARILIITTIIKIRIIVTIIIIMLINRGIFQEEFFNHFFFCARFHYLYYWEEQKLAMIEVEGT